MGSPRIGRIGHLLLVEPEASERENYKHYLKRAGFVVETAPTAAEAIGKLNDGERPAMVLSDFCLPATSGAELLRTIDRRWCFIPVIIYGSEISSAQRAQLIAQGADACFDKPLDMPKLTAFLRHRMGVSPATQSTVSARVPSLQHQHQHQRQQRQAAALCMQGSFGT